MLPALLAAALMGTAGARAAPAPVASFAHFAYAGVDNDPSLLKSPRQYSNPIIQGTYPDPGSLRVGRDYYIANSTFSYFPGIPIWHSTDLVHWTQIANAIDRASQFTFAGDSNGQGMYAPSLAYHDGTYYLTNACLGGPNCNGLFFITASNPAGPWSKPTYVTPSAGYDPALFFDDDGTSYLVWADSSPNPPAYAGHNAVFLQRIDLSTGVLTGNKTNLLDAGFMPETEPGYLEGPKLFKRHGYYYLTAAQGGTDVGHTQIVYRASSVAGPYVSSPTNPVLTQKDLDPNRPFPIASTGHATFIDTPQGDWYATFLGTRPYGNDQFDTGRETFLLPVSWSKDWPTILPPGKPVPYTVKLPALPPGTAPFPTSGSFLIDDTFKEKVLPPYWMTQRAPAKEWHALLGGQLLILARDQTLSNVADQPSYLGRRLQHMDAEAETEMSFNPVSSHDEAGIVAYENETGFYFMGLGLQNGKPVVMLHKSDTSAPNGNGTVIATVPAPAGATRKLFLRIVVRSGLIDFYYGRSATQWVPLATGLDSTILSSNTSGGFTGATLGMFAYSDGK